MISVFLIKPVAQPDDIPVPAHVYMGVDRWAHDITIPAESPCVPVGDVGMDVPGDRPSVGQVEARELHAVRLGDGFHAGGAEGGGVGHLWPRLETAG